MKKKAILLILLLIFSIVFISGCTSSPSNNGSVRSQADVQKTVTDVSMDIESVASTLNDINKDLG